MVVKIIRNPMSQIFASKKPPKVRPGPGHATLLIIKKHEIDFFYFKRAEYKFHVSLCKIGRLSEPAKGRLPFYQF